MKKWRSKREYTKKIGSCEYFNIFAAKMPPSKICICLNLGSNGFVQIAKIFLSEFLNIFCHRDLAEKPCLGGRTATKMDLSKLQNVFV